MNIRYILLTLCVVAGLLFNSSCTNLDEKVHASITESSYKYSPGDATMAVGAIYSNLRQLYSSTSKTQEVSADAIVMPGNLIGGWDDGGIYRQMHLHMWNAEQTFLNTLWNIHYTGVLLANRVYEQLEDGIFPLSATENSKSLIAEVRALRAYHYWIIMDNWENPPLKIDTSNDMPENATRKEIFEFIIAEMTAIINDLPTDKRGDYYGRFTKWAGHTLLANVYLNAGVYIGTPMWEKCAEECNAVIKSAVYRLDDNYRTPFQAQNEVSEENILVIPFDEIYANNFSYYLEALHRANKGTYNLEETPWGTGAYKGVPQFIDTYDPVDDRLDATWLMGLQLSSTGESLKGFTDLNNQDLVYENKMPNSRQVGEGEGYRWVKYRIEQGAKKGLNNDLVLFRYSQVLMMKAEALLRTGKADEAAQIVTEVRQRAFQAQPEKAIVTGSQLQEASTYKYGSVDNYVLTPQNGQYPDKFGRFYDELGWEFAGELMRRRDMIRFGHYTKVKWLSHAPAGDYKVVFPIPQRAIDSNQKLNQHTDYQ